MKLSKIKRPDKIIASGMRSLTGVNLNLYSRKKSEAKGKAKLTFIGEKKIDKVDTQLFRFSPDVFSEKEEIRDFQFIMSPEPGFIHWLNFHGLHEVKLFEELQKALNLDRLTIRQLLDTTQRPKVEDYDHYLYFSVKSVLGSSEDDYEIEQLSFILGKEYVISVQEKAGDHFDDIRSKIRSNIGLIRKRESDYLLALLLDAILDNYFETIDALNRNMTLLEREVLLNPDKETILEIESKKKLVDTIKRSLIPFNDALNSILNERTDFLHTHNLKYFRDLQYSCRNAIEEIDTTFRALESLSDIYFSNLSQKMNEVMKVLTLVATIFIPLTFIAGIYGMNFENMPELGYRYGYYIVWGVMLLVAVTMLIYFKRRGWL